MHNYAFHLVLSRPDLTEADCDALYEAGCDDATIVTRDRVTRIAFDREAPTLEDAIHSAAANVRAAGFDITRIEMDAPSAAPRAG